METFAAGVGLGDALREAAASGAAYLPGALAEPFRQALAREVAAAPLAVMPDHVGAYAVRQHGEQYLVCGEDFAAWPEIERLRTELSRRVQEHHAETAGLAGWEPDEAALQRYPAGSGRIGVHWDGKRYRVLVAIVTVTGAGTLAQCSDREGTSAREWTTTPGSLALLRGPGLAGAADGRPLHRVQAACGGSRTSLTFRMAGVGAGTTP